MAKETRQFQTEVQHLLDLVVHSLYSNKDIFLRELIANAADAIDKARFESLSNQDIAADWQIRLTVDKDKKTLTVSDNGIGMTEEEVIENIGTIAKSGTKNFLKSLEEQKEKPVDIPELIGQFGVGFYSSFMVADRVEILTRRAGSDAPAVRWSSDGKSGYTLEPATKESQGTEVTLYIKESAKEYLEEWKIREIVKKYSDFIEYPIILPTTKTNENKTTTTEDVVLNSQKAIWLRQPSEITEDEHKSFFAHISHHAGAPLHHIHLSAEGTTEFKALLYLPEKMPFNLFMPDIQKKGLQLYVRRVFITDECEELIPDYLRFIKGVVDSSDLPLNVSREILQENPLLKKIQKNIVRKVISELSKMQEKEPEKYAKFFKEFGKILKEGIHTDFANQAKLQKLAMYETMNNEPGKLISLAEYVQAMPESQKDIYYIIGDSREQLENSPLLEYFKSKGFDVIFMTDPIDEWVVQSMPQYEKKYLKPIGKGELELDEEGKKELEKQLKQATKKHKKLLEFLQEKLDKHIKEVRFSPRLTESACCLVADENDLSPHMERFFKAMNQEVPENKRILELNPNHPLIAALQECYDKDSSDPKLADYAEMLYDQALLTEGGQVADPLKFSRQVANLMVANLK